jgi:hypothetical protein
MRRYLVVANRTLAGDHLMELLRERVAQGDCELHVLVPATPDPQGWTHEEGHDRALAAQRLEHAVERFRGLDVPVSGEVGDPRPVDAIMDLLRRERFDEIVLSTLPPGVSRWLGMDLISRVERAVDVPVTHVTAAPADVSSR